MDFIHKVLFYLLLILMMQTVLAKDIFCPTNFKIISAGFSMSQVIQTCGTPVHQTMSKVPIQPPQEWNYFIPANVASPTSYQNQGTLRTSFAFDKDGKAINISVNGIGVGGTSICNGRYVQIGSTRAQVQAACGKPATIMKQQQNGAKEDVYTTFYFNTNPPKTLVFKNGALQIVP